MKAKKVVRTAGLTLGGIAVATGCVLAALDKQPFPLIVAGFLFLLISLAGDSWEEIAIKFGEGEAKVKRAVNEIGKEGLRAVEEVVRVAAKSPNLSDAERHHIRVKADLRDLTPVW